MFQTELEKCMGIRGKIGVGFSERVWYNSLGKYQIQGRKKEQLIQKINCPECNSFQLYQAADVQPVKGVHSLCAGKKAGYNRNLWGEEFCWSFC